MTLAASIRARLDAPQTRARRAEYEAAGSREQCEAVQLELLDRSWERTAASVPFWTEQVERGALPPRFASLEEVVARVPATRRATLQSARKRQLSDRLLGHRRFPAYRQRAARPLVRLAT